MPQCKCKTNDGSRCKNNANPHSDHHYCTQHDKHDKMRCVSLARPSIGYRSPARRPTYPRKSPRKSPRKASRKSPKRAKSRPYRMNAGNSDYPFTNWTSYFKAMFRDMDYPAYSEFCRNEDVGNCDVEIMNDLLNQSSTREWAQEGLDGLINTLINYQRDGDEIKQFGSVIKKMLDRGVKPDIKGILTPFYEPEHFEDESMSFSARGNILLILDHLGVKLPKVYVDAKPVYWEELIDWSTRYNNRGPKGDYMQAFYSGIKYYAEPYDVDE